MCVLGSCPSPQLLSQPHCGRTSPFRLEFLSYLACRRARDCDDLPVALPVLQQGVHNLTTLGTSRTADDDSTPRHGYVSGMISAESERGWSPREHHALFLGLLGRRRISGNSRSSCAVKSDMTTPSPAKAHSELKRPRVHLVSHHAVLDRHGRGRGLGTPQNPNAFA